MITRCPKLPLCETTDRAGGNPAKSSGIVHIVPDPGPAPGRASGQADNPMSVATSNRPTCSHAPSRRRPCFGAPMVSVTVARTAPPRGLPVSASRPDGMSTARTGTSEALTAANNWIHSGERSRSRPVPKTPSTMRTGRRGEASWAARSERAWAGLKALIGLSSRSATKGTAARTSSPLCPRPASITTRSPARDIARIFDATRSPTRAITSFSRAPPAQEAFSQASICPAVRTGTGMFVYGCG